MLVRDGGVIIISRMLRKEAVFASFSTEDLMQAFAVSMTPKFAVSYLRVSTRGQVERGGADESLSIPA